MSRFRVASRLQGRDEGEKCPRCLEGWVDFMEVDAEKGLFGCYKCGSVFVKKSVRLDEVVGKKEQLAKQTKELVGDVVHPLRDGVAVLAVAPAGTFTCGVCEKSFEKRIALRGHMRSHKNGT